jgi:hypothetical protein
MFRSFEFYLSKSCNFHQQTYLFPHFQSDPFFIICLEYHSHKVVVVCFQRSFVGKNIQH